jgi:acyl-CoA thioesterase FadM
MPNLRISELVDRVLSTEVAVPFTASDPYGHLATGRYVDAIVDHRFEAFDRQLGVSWIAIAREQFGGYFIADMQLKFLRPVATNSRITVASWITGHGKKHVSVRAAFVGVDRAAHAVARLEMIAVDTRTGRAIEHPEMPVREGAGSPDTLITSAAMLATVTGLPPE